MQTPTRPTAQSAAQLADQVRQANEARIRLEIRGGGTLAAFGGWHGGSAIAATSGLTGIIDYDPQELVVTAYSGTPVHEIERLLGEQGQMLAFEPLTLASLLGSQAAPTLGGIIASNASGPRRVHAGTVRDHFIGFEAIAGSGDVFHAGGRVFKNVTGFDLPKLMAGSWGSLAILTSVTFRVMPRPKHAATLLLRGLEAEPAVAAMVRALKAPLELSGCAHLPKGTGSHCDGLAVLQGSSATLLRLEGFAPSVEARARHLDALLNDFGAIELVNPRDGEQIWESLRHCDHLPRGRDNIWRISLPSSLAAQCIAACAAVVNGWSLDWGGGLIWLVVPPDAASPGPDAAASGSELPGTVFAAGNSAALIRRTAKRFGGHATLVRTQQPMFEESAFPELDPVSLALHSRIKQAFDPRGVFADRRRPAAAAAGTSVGAGTGAG